VKRRPAVRLEALLDQAEESNERKTMLVVHVHARVKAESVEAFKQVTLANARESIKEPGIARFDVMQQQDDPTRFVLVEAYRTPEAPAAHKETRHYQIWRDAVAPMMAEPRFSVKFANLFPDDRGW
jgi:autoinducer 2-degrading protein